MLRVAIVDQIPTPYRLPLYREMHSQPGYDLHVLFCGVSEAFQGWSSLEFGFPHTTLRGHRFVNQRRSGENYFFNPGLPMALRKLRPDVVVVSGWASPTSLEAVASAKLMRRPYIVVSESHSERVRSLPARLARRLIFKPVVRGAAAHLATGSRARRYFIELGAPEDTVFIRPNACDVDAIAQASKQALNSGAAGQLRQGLAHGLPLVLFVGRLVAAKGVDVLLLALAELERSGTPLACAIAGDGPERKALERQAAALGLSAVTFVDEVAPAELPTFYAAADVFCLPSFEEPWGVVVNEAMSAGLRVVTSEAVGATPDLVYPGENGARFVPGDASDLARALRQTLALDRSVAEARSRQIVRDWDYDRALDGFRSALRVATARKGG